jgi:TM2 domain-containing membrane protein YozV
MSRCCLIFLAILFAAFFLPQKAYAESHVQYVVVFSDSASFEELIGASALPPAAPHDSPNKFWRKLFKVNAEGKSRLVAAALAFPVTGVTGIHRIYLGTQAYVPVVYLGTLGGCLGVIPLVDFIVLLVEKDISQYENNSKIFMWVK